MKLQIGETTYTKLTSLRFDPVADVTGSEVPINELSVDVKTEDDVDAMQYAFLYDDNDTLWAKYWVIYADRMDNKTVRIKAQSSLKLLERRMLDPVMYSGESISTVLADIFYELGASAYTLSSTYNSKTVTGFCPRQSAKTRLQWVCFVIGAYVKSFFSDKVEILPIGEQGSLIPMSKTYWKPSLVYGEYITRIAVTAYSYEQGTPSTTDKWVEDSNGTTYIQSQLNHGLTNPDTPAGALTHEVHFEGVTLVNSENVDEILSNLSRLYFKRMNVEMDVVNNAEYKPGDRVLFYTDEYSVGEGYINKADFTFGVQAKSRLNITPVDLVDVALLTITYTYEDSVIEKHDYIFPVGYLYDIENPYFDQTWAQHRYIFYPVNESATGTIQEDINEDEEEYGLALESYQGVLTIYSADSYTVTEGVVRIE